MKLAQFTTLLASGWASAQNPFNTTSNIAYGYGVVEVLLPAQLGDGVLGFNNEAPSKIPYLPLAFVDPIIRPETLIERNVIWDQVDVSFKPSDDVVVARFNRPVVIPAQYVLQDGEIVPSYISTMGYFIPAFTWAYLPAPFVNNKQQAIRAWIATVDPVTEAAVLDTSGDLWTLPTSTFAMQSRDSLSAVGPVDLYTYHSPLPGEIVFPTFTSTGYVYLSGDAGSSDTVLDQGQFTSLVSTGNADADASLLLLSETKGLLFNNLGPLSSALSAIIDGAVIVTSVQVADLATGGGYLGASNYLAYNSKTGTLSHSNVVPVSVTPPFLGNDATLATGSSSNPDETGRYGCQVMGYNGLIDGAVSYALPIGVGITTSTTPGAGTPVSAEITSPINSIF